MREFFLENKDTLLTYESPVKIYDDRGIIFYDYTWKNKQYHLFNLPKGKYYTDNNLYVSGYKISYDYLNFPKPEKNDYKQIKDVKIENGNNPAKASIYIYKNRPFALIVYDHKLDNEPYYVKDFILAHEIGHLFYKSESNCDTFARILLFKLGYNPSQLKQIPYKTLNNSVQNIERINVSDNQNYYVSLTEVLKYMEYYKNNYCCDKCRNNFCCI